MGEGRIGGIRALTSGNVTQGDVFFGAWESLLIGMWGGLDLLVNPYTQATQGLISVHAFQTMDIALRDPQSFALDNDDA